MDRRMLVSYAECKFLTDYTLYLFPANTSQVKVYHYLFDKYTPVDPRLHGAIQGVSLWFSLFQSKYFVSLWGIPGEHCDGLFQ